MPNRLRVFIPLLSLAAILWSVACTTSPSSTAAVSPPTIELKTCHLGSDQIAQCGSLTVFEDRSRQAGRTIELAVAVIPAIAADPAPDPLFFIPGGPGQAAIETFSQIIPAFAKINRRHDIVLVDQRGSGGSQPLSCPESDAEETLAEEDTAALQDFVETCLAQLEADLKHYTTTDAITDLDKVRATLGYDQINLYGASYGTRVALAYLRRYPGHVRTVILDGVVSPQFVLAQNSSHDGQRALDLMFERCRNDTVCQNQFPELQTEFEILLTRLKETPRELEFAHPLSGEPVNLTFTHDAFANSVFRLLYSSELVSLLPLLIHTAYTEDDFSPLAAQSLIFAETAGIYQGMFYAVVCAEDIPFADPDAAESESYFPPAIEPLRQACALWPQADIPADFREPIVSDIPVLLFSGEADPVTPPQYGQEVAQTLPNSLHLIAAGLGHIIMGRGCTPDLTADFINSGTVTGLKSGCLQTLRPPPFFINFAGPHP